MELNKKKLMTNRGVSWKFANGAENLVLQALQFH
jgi:hypothetical protein